MLRARAVARIARRRCAQLFVVFAARRDEASSDTGGDVFLHRSGLGGRNLILVRDPFERNYMRGVGDGIDDVGALGGHLRALRDGMTHVREVYCLGHSSGGYGALLFGHWLAVDRVFSFSPRPAPWHPEAEGALLDRLREDNGRTAYEVVFAPGNTNDLALAERLAPCPGVTLFPRPELGQTHDVMHELMRRGELANLLPAFAPAIVG